MMPCSPDIARRGRHRAPGGITLMEVVIATFVMSVGLLGLAALIPVARFQMIEAAKLDRGNTLARAAFDDLRVRGYFEPRRWLDAGTGVHLLNPNNPAQINAMNIATLYGDPPSGPIPLFVLDPLGVAYNTLQMAPAGNVGQLPHQNGGRAAIANSPNAGAIGPPPPLRRLTLERLPGNAPTYPLTYIMADRLFRGSDDFDFAKSSDGELRPHPTLINASAAAPRVPMAGHEYEGDYSWIVTIAPAMSEIANRNYPYRYSPPTPSPPQPGTTGSFYTTRRYTASLVVFYKRNLNLEQGTIANPPPERIVLADFLPGTGLGGGSVRLRTVAGQNTDWLNLRPNQWIMLSAWVQDPSLASNLQAIVQWYRVRSVGGDPLTIGTDAYRDVVLDGPDFPVNWYDRVSMTTRAWSVDADNFMYATTANDPYNGNDPPTVYATIVDGAIAVHERTITLEGTATLWND